MINKRILGIIAIFLVVTAIQGFGLVATSLAHVGSITLSTHIAASEHGGNGEGAGGGPGNYGSAVGPPSQTPARYFAPRLTPTP
jgi:hypothetical protein